MVGDKGGAAPKSRGPKKYNARASSSLKKTVVRQLHEGKIDLAEAENRLHQHGLLSTRYKAQVAAASLVSAYKGAMREGTLLETKPEVLSLTGKDLADAYRRSSKFVYRTAFPDPRNPAEVRRSGQAAKEIISTVAPGGYYATHPGRIKEEWNDPLAMTLASIPAERKLKQLYRGVKEVRGARRVVGGPEYTEDWRMHKPGQFSGTPPDAVFKEDVTRPFRARRPDTEADITGFQRPDVPDMSWTRKTPRGPTRATRREHRKILQENRITAGNMIRDWLAGDRSYTWGQGSQNIVGPEGTPKHVPYGYKLDRTRPGVFYTTNAEGYDAKRTSVPYTTNMGRRSNLEEQNPAALFGQWIKDEFRNSMRGGQVLPQGIYSQNIIGRGGGPKPAGSRWRLNPQGEPELLGDLPFSQTTPHTTDFTARTQIPNKRDETRPWVHGQEELMDLKKNAEGQSFMSQLYAALGYPEMHSIPMPDDDIRDIGHAWYSPNIVGGRFNPTLSDQARRLAATLHQHRD